MCVLVCYGVLQAGSEFRSDVFNDTVSIVEVEEGFDGETFFMYVFMISGLCLLMFVVHYVYTTAYRKVGLGWGRGVGVWEGCGHVGRWGTISVTLCVPKFITQGSCCGQQWRLMHVRMICTFERGW